ncbi:uncharacterized protein (DUF305 family) [Kibdelosporangium banguiense]|uniref:Uncharacterized protein (DUF305 family) n=1 Tax=Kibdelosporangium banguiense TaxID=1365924 RepID=A0ABS4TFM8_9PSEU|nr:DUF305 domain-containing protein [Kibdelosporangium banguiense]MBP2323164.1 uncharacterized protein (DUF305 family) [Kibdelosporangium banguiense]
MTVDDRLDDEVSVEDDEAPSGSRTRIIIFSAAALAILVVGAAIGMLITLATTGQNPPPAADSVDVGFAQDMTTHHLQAVSMASWVRDHTADPTIKTLAFDIEGTQKTQVGMMAGYLDIWNQPESRPPNRQAMSWMATDAAGSHSHGSVSNHPGMEPGQLMPGMATQEELAKLRKLTGKDLDVYFLQLMIRHHEGGLSMATYGETHVQLDPLRNLARTIVTSQTGEVSYMTSLLAERGAKPLPPN